MKKIEVYDNQTLLDIAMQYYGTADGIAEIIANNPRMANDPSAVVSDGRELGAFYPDIKLLQGQMLVIDESSRIIRKTAVRKIETNVTTYISKEWQEQLNKSNQR